MGGIGSGTWFRRNKRNRTEYMKSYDIREIYRFGFLSLGDSRSTLWFISGNAIMLTWTRCNYGGVRPWFICPACGKRVGILYENGQNFSCRHCQKLTYAICNEIEVYRLIRKAQKIRRKLNASINLTEPVCWDKPKGMHWKTFMGVLERLCAIENRIIMEMLEAI